MGAELEVALFHPQEGAVNLYDTQRFANRKQRDLARATLPTCPVPECRHAADNCQVHHIRAWSKGGHTNMDNLAMLCRYHNRTNDDDPAKSHRGRVENILGTPTWRSPRGHLVANTVHPYGAMTLLYGRQARHLTPHVESQQQLVFRHAQKQAVWFGLTIVITARAKPQDTDRDSRR